jgi:cysteine-rich CPXCG protein
LLLEAQCPFCWEPAEIDFDPEEAGAGEHRFVEDCAVCCHPWNVTVLVDPDGRVSVSLERG